MKTLSERIALTIADIQNIKDAISVVHKRRVQEHQNCMKKGMVFLAIKVDKFALCSSSLTSWAPLMTLDMCFFLPCHSSGVNTF